MTCINKNLFNRWFYIQSCICDETKDPKECCNVLTCQNGKRLFVLAFNGIDMDTKTYYVNYFVVNESEPPNPISGVCNQIINNHYECVFNDQSNFQLYFTNDDVEVGNCKIQTPTVTGEFCILNIKL
jgi:hypothetical protein